MPALARITPKKVPASEAIRGTVDEPEESGPKKAWAFFAAFGIIVILMIGFYAYVHYKQVSTVAANQYNGFDFRPVQGNFWVVTIQRGAQPYDIPFYNHPRDTESVIVDKAATNAILIRKPQVIYIAFDPDAGPKPVIAGVEISRITGNKYNLLNIETHGALSRKGNATADLPVVNCLAATPQAVVIQFVQGSQNVITTADKNPNCILLQYSEANESIRVADRYAYMLLQVMH